MSLQSFYCNHSYATISIQAYQCSHSNTGVPIQPPSLSSLIATAAKQNVSEKLFHSIVHPYYTQKIIFHYTRMNAIANKITVQHLLQANTFAKYTDILTLQWVIGTYFLRKKFYQIKTPWIGRFYNCIFSLVMSIYPLHPYFFCIFSLEYSGH